MIQRIVLIKLTEDLANDASRAEIGAETQRQLSGMPGPRAVVVATPADPKSAGSWDLAVTLDFDAVEDVPTYLDHPVHRAYVDDYMRGKIECLKAWNFDRI